MQCCTLFHSAFTILSPPPPYLAPRPLDYPAQAFSVAGVTAEEWTVAMLAFFNLGWQASSLDFNELSQYLHAPLAVTGTSRSDRRPAAAGLR